MLKSAVILVHTSVSLNWAFTTYSISAGHLHYSMLRLQRLQITVEPTLPP